ncbi:hypothetical protein CALCODRAFT_138686 [Calocera cornea HHB12733]|uniref:Wbp11/ELF5/Saf1 N-terminal domain-containing protein n=1 Tax=Calocera cornea HHB12733 TaxID=1353952 RepID=A0A165K2W5_9BASI|nr:hypothetical protein CALCODRAFT_138686 [Calocera cornea HHB12733]
MPKAKNYNPADAFRKAQRKKELAKNKEARKGAKELATVKKDTSAWEEEIAKLLEQEKAAPLSAAQKSRLAELRAEVTRINAAKDAYVEAHPEQRKLVYRSRAPRPAATGPGQDGAAGAGLKEDRSLFGKNGLPLRPDRSVYYDAVMNPYGMPPPGMPYVERAATPVEGEDEEMEEDEEEDEEEYGDEQDGEQAEQADDAQQGAAGRGLSIPLPPRKQEVDPTDEPLESIPLPPGPPPIKTLPPPPLPPGPPPGMQHQPYQHQHQYQYPGMLPFPPLLQMPPMQMPPTGTALQMQMGMPMGMGMGMRAVPAHSQAQAHATATTSAAPITYSAPATPAQPQSQSQLPPPPPSLPAKPAPPSQQVQAPPQTHAEPLPPSTSAATISAPAALRDLRAEATAFVPSAVKRRKVAGK